MVFLDFASVECFSGREGEPDEEQGVTNKRPDLRNPFSKPDTSLNFGEETTAGNGRGGFVGLIDALICDWLSLPRLVAALKGEEDLRSIESNCSSTGQDSNDEQDVEDVQPDDSSDTNGNTSTPAALLRCMSLDNQKLRGVTASSEDLPEPPLREASAVGVSLEDQNEVRLPYHS